jgi:Mg-chelatase subunit ChlD
VSQKALIAVANCRRRRRRPAAAAAFVFVISSSSSTAAATRMMPIIVARGMAFRFFGTARELLEAAVRTSY